METQKQRGEFFFLCSCIEKNMKKTKIRKRGNIRCHMDHGAMGEKLIPWADDAILRVREPAVRLNLPTTSDRPTAVSARVLKTTLEIGKS